MPREKIQSCIREFQVYKATVVFSSGVYFYTVLLCSSSSALVPLAASLQEEGIHFLDHETHKKILFPKNFELYGMLHQNTIIYLSVMVN